jgi:hypothetical protein
MTAVRRGAARRVETPPGSWSTDRGPMGGPDIRPGGRRPDRAVPTAPLRPASVRSVTPIVSHRPVSNRPVSTRSAPATVSPDRRWRPRRRAGAADRLSAPPRCGPWPPLLASSAPATTACGVRPLCPAAQRPPPRRPATTTSGSDHGAGASTHPRARRPTSVVDAAPCRPVSTVATAVIRCPPPGPMVTTDVLRPRDGGDHTIAVRRPATALSCETPNRVVYPIDVSMKMAEPFT